MQYYPQVGTSCDRYKPFDVKDSGIVSFIAGECLSRRVRSSRVGFGQY